MIDMKALCEKFGLSSDVESVEALKDGLINTTYLVILKNGEKYLFQNINTLVFKRPVELMENIVNVTKYLRKVIENEGGDPDRQTLTFLNAVDGKYYYCDELNRYWRVYRYVDEAFTYNTIENPQIFRAAGKAFGKFQSMLADYPMATLHDTIPDFHNTAVRFDTFVRAVEENKSGRAENAKAEIEFALARKSDAQRLVTMFGRGELPLRVTHNDTKLNNVLFDKHTGDAFCVIDLDTVMPGLSLYDFGDSIRFGANTAAEDEPDLSRVSVSLELYESYVRGYLESAAHSLTQNEINELAFSGKLMTYECGIRFLSDYLDGDVYFKTNYPEHNLVRAKNQFALVADMERNMERLREITANAASVASSDIASQM